MEPYQAVTQAIRQGPEGDGIGVFFDLDGTLIASHSIADVFMERLQSRQVSIAEAAGLVTMALQYALKSTDFENAMSASIANLKGMPVSQFAKLGEKVFEKRLSPVIYPEMKAIVRAHQAEGHTLVIVTSATRFQVEPIARYLGISHILCTELATSRGEYTGQMEGEACYGKGKVRAAERFGDAMGIDLENCYFYSNGSEDLPLLDAVGWPVAICPDKKLRVAAKKRNWPVHEFVSRGSTGVFNFSRSVMTFSSILPAMLAGLPVLLLAGHREATNFAIATWASLGSSIAGLKLIVDGEQHLWSHRPAVFIFNHQSAIDTLIMARLVQQDIVGIAKKEIKKQPIMGPALTLAGTVFVDRDGNKDPRKVLAPAVEALQQGRSVVMAPEGTRSKDEKLGLFKRGAFHLAMQAGVSIVPVVIHNALDALPNKSMVVWPAEVKVTVLPPVSTDGWNNREVVRACRRVRQTYLDVLQQEDAHRNSKTASGAK